MFTALPFSHLFMCIMGFGTLLSLSSTHWLSIWAGLEINLIGFLPLLVYQKGISESESAMKYFIVQALGSSFIIFGSLVAFSLSFSWEVCSNIDYSFSGLCVLVMGLCIKLGVFPFYFWLPSVMAGLSWLSCFLLATWQKLAPLFLLISLLKVNQETLMLTGLCFVTAGSALVGGLGGINQTQLRPLLAYSSIGHLGWMIYAALYSEWVFKWYLLIYILISFSIFMSLWLVNLKSMKNMNNLEKFGIVVYYNIMVLLLSLGGLPPLLGFVSKWLVMQTAINNSLSFVLFFLIMGSLLSLYYYLNLFFSIFLILVKKESIWKYYEMMSMMKPVYILIMIMIMNIFGGLLILKLDLLATF
uniref:NADH-ubiquinone oxidoreductase chain 2 n=1 Tax=Lilliconus sagei TaxID=1917169 RepID=A0A1L3N1U8_9COND|nr:NADH dehydrogenase subunit 2 [Lilliconus sagei]